MFQASEVHVDELERRGYTIVPDALTDEQVQRYSAGMDRALKAHAGRTREEPEKRRTQLYGIPALDPVLVEPLTTSSTLPVVCAFLGWNIHLHHSHLDVTRPLPPGEASSYRWHRDMQSTTYTLPPPLPLLSIKVGFFLTDVLTTDRGSLLVIPGSHRSAEVQRAEDFQQNQPTAVPILAKAGSAIIMDARTWHTVGKNQSDVIRKMIYYAYTYRWVRPSEAILMPDAAALTPVERQLLGASTSDQGFHFPLDEDVPLRTLVHEAGIVPRTLEAPLTA
jgi:ectoine hydroxylase